MAVVEGRARALAGALGALVLAMLVMLSGAGIVYVCLANGRLVRLHVPHGCGVLFRGDVLHAGGAYPGGHTRAHWYLTPARSAHAQTAADWRSNGDGQVALFDEAKGMPYDLRSRGYRTFGRGRSPSPVAPRHASSSSAPASLRASPVPSPRKIVPSSWPSWPLPPWLLPLRPHRPLPPRPQRPPPPPPPPPPPCSRLLLHRPARPA